MLFGCDAMRVRQSKLITVPALRDRKSDEHEIQSNVLIRSSAGAIFDVHVQDKGFPYLAIRSDVSSFGNIFHTLRSSWRFLLQDTISRFLRNTKTP